MRLWKTMGRAALGLALAGGPALADYPYPPPAHMPAGPGCVTPLIPAPAAPSAPARPTPPAAAPTAPTAPTTPDMATPPTGDTSASSASSALAGGAPEAGSGAGGTAAPTMFGDLGAQQVCGPLTATLPGGQVVVLQRGQALPSSVIVTGVRFNFDITGPFGLLPAGQPLGSASSLVPGAPLPFSTCSSGAAALAARGAFKITENESPRPQDRVFATYNYFNNINPSMGNPTQTDVHREVVGFERTFLDGDASIGMRLPVIQVYGDPAISHQDIGDLSIIGKYALLNDRETGNVLSAGLVLTLPTGGSFLPQGLPNIHPVLLQPFVGGVVNFGDFYLLGFSSVVVPTDNRDVTFLSNDLGVGYRAYSNPGAVLSSITPTLEGHLITPLNHRGSMVDPIGLQDIFDVTAAVRLGIGERGSLGIGAVTPLTGPKPFDFEIQVQFNYYF